MAEGYGALLLTKPELVCDMVKLAHSRSSLPVSIKIRVKRDLRYACVECVTTGHPRMYVRT